MRDAYAARGERPNAPAHRERPKCARSDLAESQRGRDAVARLVGQQPSQVQKVLKSLRVKLSLNGLARYADHCADCRDGIGHLS
jgi:hypothetical protein